MATKTPISKTKVKQFAMGALAAAFGVAIAGYAISKARKAGGWLGDIADEAHNGFDS